MKTLLCWTNVTTLARGVCTVCVVLVLLGLFAPQVLRPLQPPGLSNSLPPIPAQAASARPSVSDPDENPNTARTSGFGAADGQTERTPVIEALGDFVDHNGRIFQPVQAQLQADLEQANAILLDTKRTNHEALRQANRRIRLPGRSPNLLLVIFEGLSCDSLHCYHEPAAATPGFERLAAHGARLTRFDPTETAATDWTSLFGGTASENSRTGNRRSPSFAALLWQSGYATALIGDVSKPPAPPSELGFDHWSDTSSSDPRLAIDEAVSFTAKTARQRPVATIVVLHRNKPSVTAIDETVSLLLMQLVERRLAASTVLVVVGVRSRDAAPRPLNASGKPKPNPSAEPPSVPCFAVWPDQIPKGSVSTQPTTLADVACTLLTIAEIPQRPARLKGVSQWELWRGASSPE